MKATTRHRLSIVNVLPHMTPGKPHTLKELSLRSGIARATLNIILDNATYANKIETRRSPSRSTEYYVAGTAPVIVRPPKPEGAAGPITVCAATAVGTIETYSNWLRQHAELAMLTRHHYGTRSV